MLIFIAFGLLLPLTLAMVLTGLACFIVGRPRAAMFFIFLSLDLFRRFAYFLSQVAYTSQHDSWTYSLLSTDVGYGLIWGGMFIFWVWSLVDQYKNMGGLRGLRYSVRESRDYYNKTKKKGRNLTL